MNRTDRLLALVLELRGASWTQAEALAHTFGVSTRTIYRDVLALGEAGVPVVSVPGRGYSLMPGYFLPPLQFTPPEAVMLTLGLQAVGAAFDPEYAGAALSAQKKLLAALPEDKREEAQHLRDHLRVVPPDDAPQGDSLRVLRVAMLRHHVVQFAYHKPQYHDPQAAPETRRVYPLGLVHLYGAWLLAAFDPARQAQRTFRLSRMEDVQMLPEPFHCDPAWQVGPEPTQERRDVTVRLRFAAHLKRALLERPNYFQTAQKDVQGGLEVTLQVRDVRDILAWVLSWGAGVKVLEPPDLSELVRDEARRILLAES